MAGNLLGIGYKGITFGPIEVLYGPKGVTTRYTAQCLTIQPLINYYNLIVQFGASGVFKGLDLGVDAATSAEEKTLTIEFPGVFTSISNIISILYFDQWELITNENNDTIFDNQFIVGSNSPNSLGNPILNYNDKVVLSRLARDGGTIADAITNCNADITAGNLVAPVAGVGPYGGGTAGGQFQAPGLSSPLDGYGGTAPGQLGLEILKGQTEYEKPSYVLRHTSYCNAQSIYNSSIQNTNCIYTPSQLLTEVGSGWTYNLPPRLYSKIAQIPFQYAAQTEQPYYQWGWLKKITREPVLANFMVEVNTEYVLDLWSTLRYATR